MKAELDPQETIKDAPMSGSLRFLGVVFVLVCVISCGGWMWGYMSFDADFVVKVIASFILISIAIWSILFLKKR